VEPLHVGNYFEAVTRRHSAPAAKQKLAAIRMLSDWLATGLIVPANSPATARGPKRVVKAGKTPRTSQSRFVRPCTHRLDGLFRTRAPSAAVAMKAEDVYVQKRRFWALAREKKPGF